MLIGYRSIIDFFVYRLVTASGSSTCYACTQLLTVNGWITLYDHDEFNVFEFTLQPGTSILAFYERENGLQVFCQTNFTNAPIELVFYVYGILWYRLEAGVIDLVVFYSEDGPYGVFWGSVNPTIGIGTFPVSWKFNQDKIRAFEVLRLVDSETTLSVDVVANMEFYYQNYQFNIGGLDFK